MERSAVLRRSGPVAVFAVVLAVLVALGARGGGGSGSRDLVPIPLGAAGRAAAEDSRASVSTGSAFYGGAVVIPDRLLDGVPTEGPVHDVTPGDTSTARIAALAKALGVAGEVRADSEGWVAGEGDVVLRVTKILGTPWYLGPDKLAVRPVEGGAGVGVAEPATPVPAPKPSEEPVRDDEPASKTSDDPCPPDSDVCAAPAPCPSPADGTEPACAVPPEPAKPPQPTDADARAVAQRVFDAAGLAGAPVTIEEGWDGKVVVAAPVVGGLPTAGFETRVTVALGGDVRWASGYLGGTEAKGDYPLLAPRAAVERGGPWGGYRAMDMGAPCPPEEPCPAPAPREATGLRLGLTFLPGYDGSRRAFLARRPGCSRSKGARGWSRSWRCRTSTSPRRRPSRASRPTPAPVAAGARAAAAPAARCRPTQGRSTAARARPSNGGSGRTSSAPGHAKGPGGTGSSVEPGFGRGA